MSDPANSGESTGPAGERDRGVIRAVADPAALADRRQRQAELAERQAQRRAAAAEAASGEARALLDWLELELGQARRESERLRTELERAERKRREAEQLAHSERAMRLDLGHDHAARIRRHQADARAVLELLEEAQIHAHDLGREIATLRRSAEEGEGAPLVRDSGRRARALVAELAIADATPPAPVTTVMPASSVPPGLALERAMQARHARNARLRSRGDGRGTGSLGAAAVASTQATESRLAGALIRLDTGRAEGDEVLARGPDQDRSRAAYVTEAIEGIARQIEAVRAVVALLPPVPAEAAGHAAPSATAPRPDPPAGPAGAVAPDRLAAALFRLREESPPPADAPISGGAAPRPAVPSPLAAELAAAREAAGGGAPPVAPRKQTSGWLLRALKRMLREDPALVGTFVVRLVPAQRLVLTGPVRYDIELAGAGCLAVTVRDDELHLEILAAPRPLDDVDFRIEGDLAALGRLVLYGRMRRRLSRRVARVRGDRRAVVALDWLVREPLGLGELHAGGLRLDPELILRLVAHMVDPAWTSGARFTIGYEPPGGVRRVYLAVRDGERLHSSREPPLGPVTTTIRCPEDQLLPVLAGGSGTAVVVRGAAAPVSQLRGWIARAQRDS